MPTTLIVNDRDLRTDFGFVVESFSGLTDGLIDEYETTPIPGRYGVLAIAPEPTGQFRDVTFSGHLARASTTIATDYEALRGWVSRGMVEIRPGIAPDRVLYGFYQQAPGNPLPPMMLSEWGALSLTFRCFDPLIYDRYERVYRITSSPSAIPQGTGPMSGAIRVNGQTTSPLTITKRDHAGRVTGTLVLGFSGSSFTLGTTDRVEINNLTGTIQRFVNGVAENAIQYLTSASDFPLIFGPDECDREASVWATLEVSGLSTGGAAEWIGRRTWL